MISHTKDNSSYYEWIYQMYLAMDIPDSQRGLITKDIKFIEDFESGKSVQEVVEEMKKQGIF